MAAGILFDLAITEAESISNTPELCKRVRYRQSECRECVNTCPEDAITLGLGPHINNACTGCGLCVNACPTEVFQHEFNTDEYLLDQLNSLIGKNSASKSKKSFHIHCRQVEQKDEKSGCVECLGNVTENVILGGALMGLDELVLTRGDCSQCRLAQGGTLFENALTRFRAWEQSLGLSGFVLRLEEKQKMQANETRLSRRAFFSSIARPGKHESGAERHAVDKTTSETSNGTRKNQNFTRPSPTRESLRGLLRQQVGHGSLSEPHGKFPWQTMKVDEKNCIACGICVAVCPTRALRKEYANGQLIRYFNSALCTNCHLCSEACPQKVISFEEGDNIASIIDDTTAIVARIDLTSCAVCGETIPRKEGKVCITCRKRQLSPLFM